MISYAQNHEDVLLERAFRGAASGFYVDVGASDPEEGSMTKHFYNRGWRGINVEPGSWFPQIAAARPRDINLNVAASNTEGSITFYERPGVPSLSSVVAKATEALHGDSGGLVERVVPARTLRGILDDLQPPQIDFMSIDVEGHEEEVIRGNDWQRYRPRILVVEATLPNTMVLCHHAWEPLLLDARYRFVFFNGINRFYVRDEDAALAEHFQAPVTALDPYLPVQQHNLRRANERLKQQLDELQLERQRHAEMLGGASGRTLRFGLWVARLLQRTVHTARRIVPAAGKRTTPRLPEKDHGQAA